MRLRPRHIRTYDSTKVYGALPARRTKLLCGKPYRRILQHCVRVADANFWWDILECGHRMRYYGNYRADKRLCTECPTYDDELQGRLF